MPPMPERKKHRERAMVHREETECGISDKSDMQRITGYSLNICSLLINTSREQGQTALSFGPNDKAIRACSETI